MSPKIFLYTRTQLKKVRGLRFLISGFLNAGRYLNILKDLQFHVIHRMTGMMGISAKIALTCIYNFLSMKILTSRTFTKVYHMQKSYILYLSVYF